MKLGRRIIYDLETGKILKDTGERQGNVLETTISEDFSEFNPVNMSYIQLEFGEKYEEIINKGSWKVDVQTKELIIYPFMEFSTSKTIIESDGVDETDLTVIVDEPNVSFSIGESKFIIDTIEGVAVFKFSSEAKGKFEIDIETEYHGKTSKTQGTSVLIEVI